MTEAIPLAGSALAAVNQGTRSQLVAFFQANSVQVWLLIGIFIFVVSIVSGFLMAKGHRWSAIAAALSIIGIATFTFYFQGFTQYLFVLNPPIPQALQLGNPFGGFLGLALIFLTGLGLSLLATRSLAPSIVLAFGIGSGAVSFLSMILGLFHFLAFSYTLETSLGMLAIVWGTVAWARRPLGIAFTRPPMHFRPDTLTLATVSVVGAFLLLILYLAISYPPVEWDSLAYGVTYARIIYQSGGIPLIYGPSIGIQISANYPPGTQLLASFLYSMSGGANDIYYRLLEPLFAIAVISITYLTSRTLFNDKTCRTVTILGLAAIPFFWLFGVWTSYLMFTALGYVMTMFALAQWSATSRTRYLVLAGVASGIATLTSYIGLLCFLFPLIIFGLEGRRRRAVGLYVLTCLSGAFSWVWLLRNLVLLGNPFYPLGGVGRSLDPLLYHSTVAQIAGNFPVHSLMDLLYYILAPSSIWAGLLVPIAAACVLAMLAEIIVSRKGLSRQHLLIFWFMFCSYLVFILTVALNGFFARYLLIALPATALGLGMFVSYSNPIRSRNALWVLYAAIIGCLVISWLSVMGIGGVPNQQINSTDGYLTQIYGYDDAGWAWLNAHTPANATIGSFEIRTYYINRTVVPLDGYQMAPLYSKNLTAAEIVDYLHQYNISYIFSVDWASAKGSDPPQAYWSNPLTGYLGDPDFFPTVYANPDAAVYAVGQQTPSDLGELAPYQSIDLNAEQSFTVTMTNRTTTPSSMIYIAVPPDFQGDLLSVSVKSEVNVSIELWSGLIPENMTTGWWLNFTDTARSPLLGSDLPKGMLNPVLNTTANTGYFTLALVDWSNYSEPEQLEVDVSVSR